MNPVAIQEVALRLRLVVPLHEPIPLRSRSVTKDIGRAQSKAQARPESGPELVTERILKVLDGHDLSKDYLQTYKKRPIYWLFQEGLEKIVDTFSGSKLSFSYTFVDPKSIHAHSIETDTGWKILLDRGLDIFQRYDISPLSAASRIQEERLCRSFEVTYLRQ